jgi:very-short-patch-repair endonuclease
VLWAALRNRRLADLKFRRQVVVDRYVLDHDQNRGFYLASRGLRILRIANREVFENLDEVLHRIVEVAKANLPI